MIEWVVDRLLALLGPIADLKKDKRELRDAALKAVLEALNETLIYYRDIESGTKPSRAREAQLVRLWSAAAIPVRHIDPQLASKCQDKAEYWLDPEGWDRSKVTKVGIDLESLKERYDAMLHPDKSPERTRER